MPTTFLLLTDTPTSYATHGGKTVRVKAAADGIEFVAPFAGHPEYVTAVLGANINTGTGYGAVILGAEVAQDGTAYNVTTGEYTVPSTGTYTFNLQVTVTGIAAAGESVEFMMQAGGVDLTKLLDHKSGAAGDFTTSMSRTLRLTAGTIVRFRAKSSGSRPIYGSTAVTPRPTQLTIVRVQ